VTGLLKCTVGLVPASTLFIVVIYSVLEVGFFCTRGQGYLGPANTRGSIQVKNTPFT